jgi:cytochrome b561
MKYNFTMRALHWLSALVFISLLCVGYYMTSLADSPDKWEIYGMHKSFGVIAFILVVARLLVRIWSVVPNYPASLKRRDVVLSKATVHILYLLILLMPVSGYLMSTFGGRQVKMFAISVPSLFAANPELSHVFHEMHFICAKVLVAIILLHIAGLFKHMLFERENLLKRIW